MVNLPNKPTDVFKKIDMKGGDRTQCWPWLGAYGTNNKNQNDCQPQFRMNNRVYVAYRVVLSLVDPTFNIDDPKDLVRHKCDNKGVLKDQKCCNPEHLTHGNHQQNMQDMVDRERSGLPKNVIRYIRKLLDERDDDGNPIYTHKMIARKYGISRQTVTAIKNGARYGYVKGQEEADSGPKDEGEGGVAQHDVRNDIESSDGT